MIKNSVQTETALRKGHSRLLYTHKDKHMHAHTHTCQWRMMLQMSPRISLWFPSTMSAAPIFTNSTWGRDKQTDRSYYGLLLLPPTHWFPTFLTSDPWKWSNVCLWQQVTGHRHGCGHGRPVGLHISPHVEAVCSGLTVRVSFKIKNTAAGVWGVNGTVFVGSSITTTWFSGKNPCGELKYPPSQWRCYYTVSEFRLMLASLPCASLDLGKV